jgi:hypothetical protein
MERRLASQPFRGLPSQSPKPALQDGTQKPPTQVLVLVPAFVTQAKPQLPQFAVDVVTSVSQPLEGVPSQSAVRPSHRTRQTPEGHSLPGPAQAAPQAPQFAFEAPTLTSQPLAPLPSQSRRVPRQPPMVQLPPVQFAVAPAKAHTRPQAPQSPSVERLASQPLPTMPSQSPKPGLHRIVQRLPTHVGVPFVVGHAIPQPPQ